HLFEGGEVGRGDVLQAKVEADTISLGRVRALNAHRSAWQRLAIVTGMPELQPRPLVGDLRADLPEVKWEDAWFRLWTSSPELGAAQAKVAAASWAVKKACADRCPNWEVEVGYAHDNATGFDTAAALATVPVPIWNRNQGAVRQAQGELAAAQ